MRWSAAKLLEAGLLNYVVPSEQLDGKLDWLLDRILDKSPTAIRLGKMAFHALQDMTLPQAFEYAQLMLPTMSRVEDTREGFQAFCEKRNAHWPGR